MKSSATLVLTTHRPESVLPAKQLMEKHDAVILEEPKDDGFEQMLSGELDIATYLERQDLEYPEFSLRMSEMLRDLYGSGKKFYQVEPFLDKLIEIHEIFARGGSPSDVMGDSRLYKIYETEHKATAALIEFYKVLGNNSFEEIIDAVKQFTRADAQRFLLRDHMRAKSISKILLKQGSYYIEAGHIHFFLWKQLKRRLPKGYPLIIKFLMADAAGKMGYQGHLYGPGDILTLLYMLHPDRNNQKDDSLAAKALIYNKLITKEEYVGSSESYPHTRDELENIALVNKLSFDDCRKLFPLIRQATKTTSQNVISRYLKGKKS